MQILGHNLYQPPCTDSQFHWQCHHHSMTENLNSLYLVGHLDLMHELLGITATY